MKEKTAYMLLGSLTLTSGFLTADMYQPSTCPPPVQPVTCEPVCTPTPAMGADVPDQRGVTYDAGPRVCDGANIFITADFLFWNAREDGLGYALTGSVNANATASVSSRGSVRHPDWEWDPGFKVGLGWNTMQDGWDLFAEYTWQRFNGSTDRVTNPTDPNNQLVNIWGMGGAGIGNATNLPPNQSIETASGKWDLHFNVIDLELGRNYYIGRWLKLRPHFGLKGTWQDQYYKVRYTQIDSPAQGSTTEWQMDQEQCQWAVGLRTGVDTSWQFTRSFSLFGNWALSPLYTSFDVTRKDRQIVRDAAGDVTTNLLLASTKK